MKKYCPCGKFVAEIVNGSQMRNGSVIICYHCFERFKSAEQLAKMYSEKYKSAEL